MSTLRDILKRGLRTLRMMLTNPAASSVQHTESAAPLCLTCKLCKREFNWSVSEQRRFAAREWAPPLRCEECRNWRQSPRRTRGLAPGTNARDILSCQSCGEAFAVTPETRAWLAAQGHQLPRRCGICRQNRRRGGKTTTHSVRAEGMLSVRELIGRLQELQTVVVLTGDPLAPQVAEALEKGESATVGELVALASYQGKNAAQVREGKR